MSGTPPTAAFARTSATVSDVLRVASRRRPSTRPRPGRPPLRTARRRCSSGTAGCIRRRPSDETSGSARRQRSASSCVAGQPSPCCTAHGSGLGSRECRPRRHGPSPKRTPGRSGRRTVRSEHRQRPPTTPSSPAAADAASRSGRCGRAQPRRHPPGAGRSRRRLGSLTRPVTVPPSFRIRRRGEKSARGGVAGRRRLRRPPTPGVAVSPRRLPAGRRLFFRAVRERVSAGGALRRPLPPGGAAASISSRRVRRPQPVDVEGMNSGWW